ncbi:MAG: hypothetical protein ACRC8K_13895 [Waterburya sp.]
MAESQIGDLASLFPFRNLVVRQDCFADGRGLGGFPHERPVQEGG